MVGAPQFERTELEGGPDGGDGAQQSDVYYVYFHNGDVAEVGPADELHVTDTDVVITMRGKVVRTYERRDVYSCSKGIRVAPQSS